MGLKQFVKSAMSRLNIEIRYADKHDAWTMLSVDCSATVPFAP